MLAVGRILAELHALTALPENTLTIRERNGIIRDRYAAGVSQVELARQFDISYQRVHQIVHGQRKRIEQTYGNQSKTRQQEIGLLSLPLV